MSLLLFGKKSKSKEASSHQISIVRQTVFKLCSEHRVSVTTAANGSNTTEPRIFKQSRQSTFAAHSVIDVVPSQPFHILVTKFYTNAMHVPKHMV